MYIYKKRERVRENSPIIQIEFITRTVIFNLKINEKDDSSVRIIKI